MDIFEMIKKDIMDDPDNEYYTNREIEPLYKASEKARLVIVGQAPGRIAEETGLYWNDLSGDRLMSKKARSARRIRVKSGFCAKF